MLSLVLGLFSQQILYQTNYTPHFKEIVIEEEILPPLPLVVLPEKKKEYNVNCYCVSYLREYYPNLPRQDAKDFKKNSNFQDGEIVILDYDGVRHIAKYEITNEGLLVDEANYIPCKSGKRLIKYKDLEKDLVGFYNQTLLDNQNKIMTDEKEVETTDEAPEVEATPEVEEEKEV